MRKLVLIALVAAATAGCGIVYRQPIYQGNLLDQAQVQQLQVGMSKEQVMGLLGTPSIADPLHADRWDYTATQRTRRVGPAEVKNFVLHFENGALARWEGDYFAEQDAQLSQQVRRQFGPNLPRDDSKNRRRRGGN